MDCAIVSRFISRSSLKSHKLCLWLFFQAILPIHILHVLKILSYGGLLGNEMSYLDVIFSWSDFLLYTFMAVSDANKLIRCFEKIAFMVCFSFVFQGYFDKFFVRISGLDYDIFNIF